MKKNMIYLFVLILITGISCKEKADPEKEKEAIKALLELEKDAFFKQDYAAMAETWIQEPSSVKIYMGVDGQQTFEGWEAISKHDQANIADTTWDRKQVSVTFSDYRINIMDESAWVMCVAHWEKKVDDSTMAFTQTRIQVLEKIDGKWKLALMALYGHPN